MAGCANQIILFFGFCKFANIKTVITKVYIKTLAGIIKLQPICFLN